MPVIIGATGLALSTAPIEVALAGAQAYLVPSGQYMADVGRYSLIQYLDPGTGIWRTRQPRNGMVALASDGTNVRLINSTGCPAGAIVTAKGSAYTNGIGTVGITVSSGSSVWQSIVGGAFNSAITVTTGGTYNYVPTIIFPQPVAGGIRATATAAIASATISTVTFTDRGAGWVGTVPTSIALNNQGSTPASSFYNPQSNQIQIIQDPRDTGAGGGVLTLNATLADSGALTGVMLTDPGIVVQTTLPTLTFASGTASAIVIMNWTATGITVNGGGAAYGNAGKVAISGVGLLNQSTAFAGDTNPTHNLGIITPRNFLIEVTATSAGAVSSASIIIDDAGFGIQRVPEAVAVPANTSALAAIPTAAATLTMTMGATTDVSWLEPFKL